MLIGLSHPQNLTTEADDTNKVSSKNGGVRASVALAVRSRLPVRARGESQGTNSRPVYIRYPRTGLPFVAPMVATMGG